MKEKKSEKTVENNKKNVTADKRSGSKSSNKKSKDLVEEKVKLSTRAWALIITASVLAVIFGAVAIYLIVDSSRNDKRFDYLTSNLSRYVSFSEDDYKNYKLEIDIAKPHEIDVEVAILNLLASDKGAAQNDGKLMTDPVTVTPGDIVHIWYRGYLLDEDGKEIVVPGMCNFTGENPTELEIGSSSFVPGFELGLVGKNTGDYPKFTKITEGGVKENQIAYIAYTSLVEGGNKKTDGKSGNGVRIDLSDETLDDTYGKGFRDQILAATIGQKMSFAVTIDGKVHNYTDTSVMFVTECEVDPLVVECYFPYDYTTKTLRNETAHFEVYIYGVQEYECPEFDDEYVKKKVGEKDSAISEEELLKYEGDTLVEKYRAYAKETIDEAYKENYESMVEDAMWDYYLEKAEIKRYPKIKVDAIYKEYEDDVYYQFDQSGGSIQNSYGEYETFDNVDDFAVEYLGLTYSENKDWKSVLYTMSENLVKERLVLYYLMKEEGLVPDSETFAKELSDVRQEYLDEYVKQYLENENKTREDYDDVEFEKFVEDRKIELFDYYDDEYFEETTYYEIALREFIKWPEVSTLDNRRAYPQSK